LPLQEQKKGLQAQMLMVLLRSKSNNYDTYHP
jgi:hypothetical protein